MIATCPECGEFLIEVLTPRGVVLWCRSCDATYRHGDDDV